MTPPDSPFDFYRSILSGAITALAAFLGVVVGALLTSRRERTQRRLAFTETRLKEFYSPMLGMRKEIRMLSELRLLIDNATIAPSDDSLEEGSRGSSGLGFRQKTVYEKQIDYNNKQLREKLLPTYQRMTELFRDKYWLADVDTREFYPELVEYVEIWNRSQANAIVGRVLERLQHAEAKLNPFYEHIQVRHDELRKKIEDGKP
jgi:hypothetical protein